MENTLENKARFFAQYFGQKVYNNLRGEENINEKIDGLMLTYTENEEFLRLKDISLIQEEHLKHVLNSDLSNIDTKIAEDKIGNFYYSDVYLLDYLRSKGYALPYMGLSVEKQIEYGWVKLTEND